MLEFLLSTSFEFALLKNVKFKKMNDENKT